MYNTILKLATEFNDASKIFEDKFNKNKIRHEFEKTQHEVEYSIKPDNDIDKEKERRNSNSLKNEMKGWRHSFSDVRKDSDGFYILKSDNPAGKDMSVGDLLSDNEFSLTAYWEIASISGDRINLTPIGTNPFLTGVGAGGKNLSQKDVSVFSGQYEKDKFNDINQKIQDGRATIDDVVYLLDGTVPTQMGPNGAQGGWYSINDSSNRGMKKGMSPEDIVISDAKMLKDLGFSIPVLALSGEMQPDKWESWVNGNGAEDVTYIPKNLDSYIENVSKIYPKTDKEGYKRKLSLEDAEKYYNNVIKDFNNMNSKFFQIKYPHLPESLKSIVDFAQRDLKRIEEKLSKDKYLTEGEDDTVESIIRNVFSRERRVAIRNTLKLIEMTIEDEQYKKYLYNIIRLGNSDYFVNEKIIDFFNDTKDIVGLKLAIKNLKDKSNIDAAFYYLSQIDLKESLGMLDDNTPLSVFSNIINHTFKSYPFFDRSEEVKINMFNDINRLINFVNKFDLINKIEKYLKSDNYEIKNNAKDLLSLINYKLQEYSEDIILVQNQKEFISNISELIKG